MALIVCPNCQHRFEPTDALRAEIQQDLRNQMQEWKQKREAEMQQKELEFQRKLREQQEASEKMVAEEREKVRRAMEEEVRKQVSGDFENLLKLMQEAKEESEAKLAEARKRELEFMRKEHELANREKELELELQKQLLEERAKLTEIVRGEQAQLLLQKEQEYQLRLKDMEQKFEQQKLLAEEMKRKAEQASMQTQGESAELVLEDMLRNSFPFDLIEEVGKGVRGADCIQTVRNQHGQPCGRIIYESKRTQSFSNDWIEKLKADMRSQGADLAVIVTQSMPRDMPQFGQRDGIWICQFSELRPLATVLRDGLLRIAQATRHQENKGTKMHLLYDYLTSAEFNEQWSAIREGFRSMKEALQRERDAMERLWKAREKQLDKVMVNMLHFKGSIEGIAGQDFNLGEITFDEPPLLPE